MSSFFTRPASERKRKRTDARTARTSKRRATEQDGEPSAPTGRRSRRPQDENREASISGSDSEDPVVPDEAASEPEVTSEEDEHPDDRRVRLAQRYLDNIREEIDETGFDAEEIDKDLIAKRLREDVEEATGRQYRLLADKLDWCHARHTLCRGTQAKTTTGVAVCMPHMYTVSKDKCLIKWELADPQSAEESGLEAPKDAVAQPQRQRPRQLDFVKGVRIDTSSTQQHGHIGPILSVAASPDGRYVATGGADRRLIVWSAATLKPLKTFTTHRDAVTSLSFSHKRSSATASQQQDSQLFSASMDRTIKTYSLDPSGSSLAYVETLFGHQDRISAIAAMAIDQAVSVGSRDRTARLWKVVEETQLVFRADTQPKHESYSAGSVDCVAALSPTHFVTGSDNGSISLWTMHKKKALFTIPTAHGVEEPPPLEDVTSETSDEIIAELKRVDRRRPMPRAITALASLRGSDVVVSGSWDGFVRVWRVSEDKRTLEAMGNITDSGHQRRIDSGPTPEPDVPIGAHADVEMVNGHTNGESTTNNTYVNAEDPELVTGAQHGNRPGPARGIINSLAVFERRKQLTNQFGSKKEGDTVGLCIVAGTGKEPRLGRWRRFTEGKNGAVVIEVPVKGKIS